MLGSTRSWAVGLAVLALTGLVPGAPAHDAHGYDDGPSPGAEHDAWPALDDARIRPGVVVAGSPERFPGIDCTANFVFTGPGSALYIGMASHCLGGRHVGDTLAVAGIPDAGRIAYCSLPYHTGLVSCGPAPPAVFADDFALLSIEPAYQHLVHPAVLHWGGPTTLLTQHAAGVAVYGYFNSTLNPIHPLNAVSGSIRGVDADESAIDTVRPATFGDSGAPVIDADGAAIGHVTGPAACCSGYGGAAVSHLDVMLALMAGRGGPDVTLATWPLLHP